jgi:hypothetical protein
MPDMMRLIGDLRERFAGFNPPAPPDSISRLQSAFNTLPEAVFELYRNHDGSGQKPVGSKGKLATRLMPIDEVLESHRMIARSMAREASLGSIAWLWTDDNSDYAGVYLDGILAGWVVRYDHEEPTLCPTFRSVGSFVSRLMEFGETSHFLDVQADLPEASPNAETMEQDRRLCAKFLEQYRAEVGDDRRRLYAMCSIALTPFEDTAQVLSFLDDPDMWTPEAAVKLLGFRRFQGGVDQLERLARDGRMNGDSAAMAQLVRLKTAGSADAITRLKASLSGTKLQLLDQYLRAPRVVWPRRWA